MSGIDEFLKVLRGEPDDVAQRAADLIERMQDALIDVGDLIDDYVDIRDGAEGQQLPNDAMKALQIIDEVLR